MRKASKTSDGMFSSSIKSNFFSRGITLNEIVEAIKTGKYRKQIDAIRLESDKKKRTKLKQELPVFTLGLSNDLKRGSSNLVHSSFLLLDFDYVEDTQSKKREIISDPEVCCCFISPSGNGLKVAYKLDEAITDSTFFSRIYKQLASLKGEKYGLVADHTSDALRLCYYSFDEEIFYNPNCDLLNLEELSKISSTEKRRTRGRKAQTNIKIPKTSGKSHKKSPKNHQVDEEFVVEILQFLVMHKISYIHWIKVAFYLCALDRGEELFIDFTVRNKHFSDTIENAKVKFAALKSAYNPVKYPPSIYRLVSIATNYGYQNKNFYYIDPESGSYHLIVSRFYLEFLPSIGIYYVSDRLIHLENNIYRYISQRQFKRIVLDGINALKISDIDKENLIMKVVANDSSIYTEGKMNYIEEITIEEMRDRKDNTNLIFSNCWVEVLKDNIKVKPLSELPKPVLFDQIIQRKFQLLDLDPHFGFNRFLMNITSTFSEGNWIKSQQKLESLKTAIGYLLNGYKDPTNAKAVIFIDELSEENIDLQSHGGNGKSLTANSLGHMLYHTTVSGKRLAKGNRFAMQCVVPGMRLVNINDIKKGYDFEDLYEMITDAFEVEKKGETSIIIPFEKSPKLLISTNRPIGEDDISTKRRKHEVEFSHYYGLDRKPMDDFEEVFFDDKYWTDDSWNKFYRLMIECIQLYLSKGLLVADTYSYYRIMIANTNRSFIEYCEKFQVETTYNKTDELEEYRRLFPSVSNTSAKKFKQYLDTFAKAKQWDIIHRSSNGKSLVEFSKKQTMTAIPEVSMRKPVELSQDDDSLDRELDS
jgi:hypothetical protein